MGLKFRLPFSSRRLRQYILLSRSTSSSIGMKLISNSEENLKKLGECMDNMDIDEMLFMDLPEDPELFRLLNDYFSTSKGVSNLCESLRDRDEKLSYGGGSLEASSRKTINDLRNFLEKSRICHENLTKVGVELEKRMKKIDRRLNPVRAIVAAALTVFDRCDPRKQNRHRRGEIWRSREALEREKTAMITMERGAFVCLKKVEKICKLVSRLENVVERSIRETAERSSVAVAMEEERKKFESTLVDLDREIVRCHEFAKYARTLARDRIVKFLTRGDKRIS